MIRSMTGFGQSGLTAAGFRIQADLKSVNHRYTEIMVRMPREWLYLEDSVKKLIQKEVKRGRVDVFLTIEKEGDSGKTVELDWELAEGYRKAALQLQERLGLSDSLTLKDLLQIPELIRFRDGKEEDKTQVEEALHACIGEAVSHLVSMRIAEGTHLQGDLTQRITAMREFHSMVKAEAPKVTLEYRDKLNARLKELLGSVPADENRVALEVALFADRSNIDEELTRLESHFAQFDKLLAADEPSGRKLDFLLQEMNREVNTIGSKANRAELSNLVVEMKAELEKIREQVQNIE